LTRKEIRANRARVVGNILPVYSEMMKTHEYEIFNAKQDEDGTGTFKNINSTLRNLYALNKGVYNAGNVLNWICEHPRAGTGLTGANLKKAFATTGGVNMGRGYLTVYATPVIQDPTSNLNPDNFCYTVELDYDSSYAYAMMGFLNSAEDNVSPGISKKLDNLVSYRNKDNLSHVLEYKMVEGILYLYVDGWYTGQYLDVTGQSRDLMCAFYMGSASSNYTGIVVKELRLEPLADVYPSTYLASNLDVWVCDKVKNGTGVATADRVAPFVNEETGRMNAGRGYCAYMSKGIINPYNQSLKSRFTLSCTVYCDDGTGQEILFGELNSDGTDITGAFKTALVNICNDDDFSDSISIEYRCLDGHAYLYVNGRYTGKNRDLNSINYMLGMYNNKALTSNDGVEMNNITITDTCNLYPFQYQIMNLAVWQYAQYTGDSSTNTKEPFLVSGAVDVGGGNYTYLNAPIRIEDNVDYRVTFTFTGSSQRIGLGQITTVSGKISPTGIDQPIINFISAGGQSHRATFKVYNKVAYLFFDGEYSGVKYDFSNETLRQYDKNKHPFLLDEFVSSHTSNFQEEMSINSDGSLYCGVGTNIRLKNRGTGLEEYFRGDFKIECTIEETGGSHYMIQLSTPSYESGAVQLNKYTNGSNGIQERGTSGTVTKSTGLSAHPFTTTANPRNTLTIQRLNGVVTISYTDTNGTNYSYTSEQNLGNNRCNITFYGYTDGTLNIHNLKVTPSPIFIGFYDNDNSTGIRVQNIEALPGTLSKAIGDNLILPPADTAQWKYIEDSSFFSTTSGEQIRAADNMIYTARYKFNTFLVPLSRVNENEYIVEFRKGSHAYIGITNDPNTVKRRVAVHVTEENGFDESGSTNTLSISFRGSSYYLSNRGGFVDANNLPSEFGDNVYLIVYQNNSNDRMVIERIYENVAGGGE